MSEADPANPSLIQNVTAVNGFAYGVIGADIHVFGNGLPLYLLSNWQSPPEATAEWMRELPSRMLNARREIVPFTGRDSELASLREWRDRQGRLAVRWLYGPGGQGKTRLAAQFAAESAASGWKVVSAYHGPDADSPEPGSQDMSLAGFAGLLLVVDYADRWMLSNLTWLLKNALLHQTGVPTRVLMLARTADAWPRIRGVLDTHQAQTSSQPLTALAQGSGERASMFAAARATFAAVYELPGVSGVDPPGALSDPEFGLTLALHMAALVAVDAHVTGQRPPRDMAGLTVYLLDREQLHWARLYADGTLKLKADQHSYCTPPEVMNEAVFAAALTGNLAPAAGTTLLENLQLSRPARVLTDHAFCYPSGVAVLEPLYPDRLAEDFLALTLPGHPADYPSQAWAGPAVSTLLARHGDDRPAAVWTPRAITFLSSAAHRWPHLGTRYLYPLLVSDPQLALDAGSAALTTISRLPDLDPVVMEAVEGRLPKGRDVDLDTGIAALVQRLTTHRLSMVTDPATRAGLLAALGWRLANAGQMPQALAAAEEAVRIYREQAAIDPAAFKSSLAMALDHMGTRLAWLGRDKEAMTATEEAVRIRRQLATENFGYAHLLAESLNNLGNRLWRAGQRKEAVAAAQEAVQFRRRLASADPASDEPNLATELHNLGIHLSSVGRREEALAAADEAVRIRRRLAEANPAVHEPHLAAELNDLGLRQSEMGWREEALATAEQAVEVSRRLVGKNRLAFEPDFGRILHVYGQSLAFMGRRQEALAIAMETLQVHRRLAAQNPAASEPDLAAALDGLCTHLANMGRRQDALAAAQEAVQVRRRLAKANPEKFEPYLAVALNNLGQQLAGAGRSREALGPAEEAVKTFRRLAAADWDTYAPPFAGALGNLATRRFELGLRREALPVAQEAVEVLRRLTAVNPAAFEPDLAAGLNNLGLRLTDLGRHQEALRPAEEAVQINRRLAGANLAAFQRKHSGPPIGVLGNGEFVQDGVTFPLR